MREGQWGERVMKEENVDGIRGKDFWGDHEVGTVREAMREVK